MPIVNFNITDPLEKRITRIIKEQGFAGKAEFFRFLALTYIHNLPQISEQHDLTGSINSLKETINKKIEIKNLPALEEQFADLL